jgi:hypothetical protein
MRSHATPSVGRTIVVLLVFSLAAPLAWSGGSDLLRFAARMAKEGNWREAVYRWEQAADDASDDPRILNNLAVSMEVLGDAQRAGDYYRDALTADPRNPAIRQNFIQFRRAWASTLGEESDDGIPGLDDQLPRKAKAKKSATVAVPIPVAPRVDVEGMKTFLVASFQTVEIELLDTNREMVRFVRREIAKYSGLEPIQPSPPPAIPEQNLEDLIANDEFWRHLGREYQADLVVSGVFGYDRLDASGFEEVDVISGTTGQKVRKTRFVEKEEFRYKVTVLFIDGRTGELLFRDDLKRGVMFQGTGNDPVTAFYQISELIGGDIVSVVAPRRRIESRIIFEG